MSVGLGLFLGLTVLSLTLLYVGTKDRWKWKRIWLWIFLVFGGLPVLGLGIYYLWSHVPRPAEPCTELWGISLGMPRKEVLFRKGPPSDSTSLSSLTWTYKSDYEPTYRVGFARDSVDWVVAERGG